jgi:zinc protease
MRTLLLIMMSCCAVMTAQAGMADKVVRSRVGGVDILYPTPIKDVVTIVGSLPAGDAFAPEGQAAVPTLTGMMLDRGVRGGVRGAAALDKYEIAKRLESVGAAISFDVGTQTLDIRAKCLAKDLPLVIELLAAQLRQPSFEAAEFERVRQQFIGAVRSSIDNSGYRARDAFNRALFPASHPNHPQSIETLLASARAASLDQVRAFHDRLYGPRGFTLVLVGAIDVPKVRKAVAAGFAGWNGGAEPLSASAVAAGEARTEVVTLEGKPSVSILLGQPTGLRYRDPDALALRVGTAVLGQGFTGRLMSSVRDREGLTYGIGAGVSDDTYSDGAFGISATFAPQLLDKGIASTRRELQRWWQEGVTTEELAQRKQSLVGSYQVGLSSTGGIAAALLSTTQRGLELSWLDRYPQLIRDLTLAQVNGAIRRHLDPQRMTLVEAGSLGKAPPPAAPEATPEAGR